MIYARETSDYLQEKEEAGFANETKRAYRERKRAAGKNNGRI